jgi:MAF protein
MESARHPVLLASKSPRRRELLEQLGISYQMAEVQVNECPLPGESPEAAARRLSLAKAQAVAAHDSMGKVVLAADTIVTLDGRILGKPRDEEQAREMLRFLRGRPHQVITAQAVLSPSGRSSVQVVETTVWMRNYSDEEIEVFVASGEPFDKAGAYAIQSQPFQPVERIQGCYLNVVGLPLCHVQQALLGADVAPRQHPVDVCPEALKNGCPLALEIAETVPNADEHMS